MLTQNQLLTALTQNIDDIEVRQRYQAGDPIITMQLKSIATFLSLLSKDMEIASLEPFIKAKDRSILADASNKGVLPLAVACQHEIEIFNNGVNPVTLSQGRKIEDNSGARKWRLLKSVTIEPNSSLITTVEQSEYREIQYTVPKTEPFHQVKIQLQDDMNLTSLVLRDNELPSSHHYTLQPKWFNVNALDYTATLTTDEYESIYVEFGDSERVGRTAQQGEVFTLGLTESHGYVETERLKDASLLDVYTTDEQKIGIKFKLGAVVRAGADPLNISQLRVLASYPSLYDDNAVFLGQFDFLLRKKFMNRCYFISVWNENLHERHFGADWKNINHLNVAFIPINESEKEMIKQDIARTIAYADSLYTDRVNFYEVEQKPFKIYIQGKLSAVHDIEQVKEQIIGLLVDKYGKNSLKASQWLVNGFNTQEITTLLRNHISAFNDNMSDFYVQAVENLNKPNQWTYVTHESVQVELQHSAETIGNAWLM